MSRRAPAATPRHLRPYSTLSITRIQGKTLSRWKTIPRSRPGPSISLPSRQSPQTTVGEPRCLQEEFCRNQKADDAYEFALRHNQRHVVHCAHALPVCGYSCGRGERVRSFGDRFQSASRPPAQDPEETPCRKPRDQRGRQTIGDDSSDPEHEQRGQNSLRVGRSAGLRLPMPDCEPAVPKPPRAPEPASAMRKRQDLRDCSWDQDVPQHPAAMSA